MKCLHLHQPLPSPLQTEVDFDENTSRLEKRLDEVGNAAETREERLRIDNHLLKRSNLRSKGDLAIEKKKMDRMLRDNTTLREGMTDQQVRAGGKEGGGRATSRCVLEGRWGGEGMTEQ